MTTDTKQNIKAPKTKATAKAPLTDEQRAAVTAACAVWNYQTSPTEQAALVATVLGNTKADSKKALVWRLLKDDTKARNAFFREVIASFPKAWQEQLNGSRLSTRQRVALLSAVSAYRYVIPQSRCAVLIALRGEEIDLSWVSSTIVSLLPTPALKEQFYSLRIAIAKVEKA